MGGGGHMKFYRYEKGGGAEKVVAMLNGGHTKFWGSFYMVAYRFSHIVGRHEKFPLFKRGVGAQKVLPCFEVGRKKVSGPRFSHFVDPPPRN